MTVRHDGNIQDALRQLQDAIRLADRDFDTWHMIGDDDFTDPSWQIEICFLQLMAITEAIGLEELRRMQHAEYTEVRASRGGFSDGFNTEEGDVYSTVLPRIRKYLRVLEAFFPSEDSTRISTDLLQIIRDMAYVITNKDLYGKIPSSENDVHLRAEGILKCVFPDLMHKPPLMKQIKNFIPDTGIPSLKTLIEYKFLTRKEDAGKITDEILADTRGYQSRDWQRYLYVVYETQRFKNEKDWNQLLRQSKVPHNTMVVVLSGEPLKAKRKRRPKTAK